MLSVHFCSFCTLCRWLSNDKTLWKAANHNLASQMVAEAIQGAIPRRHGTEVRFVSCCCCSCCLVPAQSVCICMHCQADWQLLLKLRLLSTLLHLDCCRCRPPSSIAADTAS